MTLLEKAARALAQAAPESDVFYYPYEKRKAEYDAIARAVLEAMREPTGAMLWPQVQTLIKNSDAMGIPGAASYEGCVSALVSVWQGMIDAALAETPEPPSKS